MAARGRNIAVARAVHFLLGRAAQRHLPVSPPDARHLGGFRLCSDQMESQDETGDGSAPGGESRVKAEARHCVDGLVDAALANDPSFTATHANVVKALVFRMLENEEQGAGLLRVAELTRSTIFQVAGHECLRDGVDQLLGARDTRVSGAPQHKAHNIEPRRRKTDGGAKNVAEAFRREVQGVGRLLTNPETKRYLGLISADGSKLRLTRERGDRPGQLQTFGDLEVELLDIARARLSQRIEHLQASLPAAIQQEEERSFVAIADKVKQVKELREVRGLIDTTDRIKSYYADKAEASRDRAGGIWEDIFSFFSD